MFGNDFEVKELQIRAEHAGADMATINAWIKSLPKIRRRYNVICTKYVKAFDTMIWFSRFIGEMYRKLATPGAWKFSEKREVKTKLREFKSYRHLMLTDFALTEEDTEFLLTYDTIIRQLWNYDGSEDMRICLRSEIENMDVMIDERFDPNMVEPLDIAIFYMRHTFEEVRDLPLRTRVETVEGLNRKEFYEPIARKMEVVDGYDLQRIINIVKRYVGLRIREEKDKGQKQRAGAPLGESSARQSISGTEQIADSTEHTRKEW